MKIDINAKSGTRINRAWNPLLLVATSVVMTLSSILLLGLSVGLVVYAPFSFLTQFYYKKR